MAKELEGKSGTRNASVPWGWWFSFVGVSLSPLVVASFWKSNVLDLFGATVVLLLVTMLFMCRDVVDRSEHQRELLANLNHAREKEREFRDMLELRRFNILHDVNHILLAATMLYEHRGSPEVNAFARKVRHELLLRVMELLFAEAITFEEVTKRVKDPRVIADVLEAHFVRGKNLDYTKLDPLTAKVLTYLGEVGVTAPAPPPKAA